MVYSPVQVIIGGSIGAKAKPKVITGALFEKKDLREVVGLISKCNANGLVGKNALIMMKLVNTLRDLSSLNAKKPAKEEKCDKKCECTCEKKTKGASKKVATKKDVAKKTKKVAKK